MTQQVPWLEPDDPFPRPENAWGEQDPAPGLLAAGGSLAVDRLRAAYAQATFPWYSDEQPILWWAPDPRMVLAVETFRLHRSMRKTLQAFRARTGCEIRVDTRFRDVITACAHTAREGQGGTWIVPDMIEAYCDLHAAGNAHSIETWIDGRLVGGLYCVAIGQAVFGESMFAHESNASKIALAALVCLCRQHGIEWIDCQQNTRHLASMGAGEMPRSDFLRDVDIARQRPTIDWQFQPVYWSELLPSPLAPA